MVRAKITWRGLRNCGAVDGVTVHALDLPAMTDRAESAIIRRRLRRGRADF
jgi:hypothetical protein